MTEAEALRELSRRLIFGDEKQIQAVKFLGNVNECGVAVMKCKHGPFAPGEECSCTLAFTDDVLAVVHERMKAVKGDRVG